MKQFRACSLALVAVILPLSSFAGPHSYSDDVLRSIDEDYVTVVQTFLSAKCGNCHEPESELPFYASLPGISEVIQKDVNQAQQKLLLGAHFPFENPSSVSPKASILALRTAVLDNTMPPTKYVLLHWTSTLSRSQKDILLNWIDRSLEKLEQEDSVIEKAMTQDQKVERLFQERCTRCHNSNVEEDFNKNFTEIENIKDLVTQDDYVTRSPSEKIKEGKVFKQVRHNKMPPSKNDKLTEEEHDLILDWLKAGAPVESIKD